MAGVVDLGTLHATTDPLFKSPFGDNSAEAQVKRHVAASNSECKNPGVTDAGVARVAKIRGALNAAILGMNTYTTLKIAELQYDLAKDYADLATKYREHYFNRYHPIEKELISEAQDEPEYVRSKEQLNKGQMLINAKLPLVGKLERAMSCTGRYCTGQRQVIAADILLEQAMVESLVCGLASRYTDDEEVTRNHRRWERRSNVLKLGSNIPTEAVSYASLATGIFGSIGEQASKGAEGAAWFLGHRGMRQDTHYPPKRPPLTVTRYIPEVPKIPYVEPYEPPPVVEKDKPEITIDVRN